MGSHFRLSSGAAMVCAVSGATAMLPGICSAQFTAADYATNSTYASSWSAGQNGGFGFGAWSFNGTVDTNNVADPGGQQMMTTGSSIGKAWTLFNLGTKGISDTGRAINGGMPIGARFETVIQNPTTYHFYRGWDISFMNATDNNPAGNNNASLFVNVFNYNYAVYNGVVPNWSVTDGAHPKGFSTTVSPTASPGLKPLSNPSAAYSTGGTLSTNLPIDWVQFRLYNGGSSGPSDTANNFEVSYMTIVPEPSTLAFGALGLGGLLFLRRRK